MNKYNEQKHLHFVIWLLDERELVHVPAAFTLETGPEEPIGKKSWSWNGNEERNFCPYWELKHDSPAHNFVIILTQLSPFLIHNYKMSIGSVFRRESEHKNVSNSWSKIITNSTTVKLKIKHLCRIQNTVFSRHEISFIVCLQHPTLLQWDMAYINMSRVEFSQRWQGILRHVW